MCMCVCVCEEEGDVVDVDEEGTLDVEAEVEEGMYRWKPAASASTSIPLLRRMDCVEEG